jgi:ribonuclease HI
LRALKEPCEIEVVTDSEYLKKGITEWIAGWKRRNWLTKDKKPVLNKDLWLALDELASQHTARWTWTRGHASHEDNNRADELATGAAAEQAFSRGYKRDPKLPAYDLASDGVKAGRS